MKFMEVFCMLKDLSQEFSMARFFAGLLTRSHILLESVQSSRLFLILVKSFRALVKFTINELSRIHDITKRLATNILHH